MTRRVVLGVLAVAVLVAAALTAVLRPWTPDPPDRLVAAAWLPVWDERAPASLAAALDEGGLTEVSPTWATVRPDGSLAVTPPPPEVRERLAAADGVQVIPAVQNYADGAWQGDAVARLLADPAAAEAHRRALVDLALTSGWDGVDVDYESLPPLAGPVFTQFLRALRDDLHAHGLQLTVAVPARDAEETPYALAYSYRLIGQIADQVRLMTYDHAWSGSPAGPVAPASWVEDVVAYAVQHVPRHKLMLGLATYGYDWVGDRGSTVQAVDALALADRVGARPRWDDAAAAWTFGYAEGGREHTVWFEDARSLARKQQLAVAAGLRGIAIWQLGGEDPQVWTSVSSATRGGTPS
ncbi:glycosyl hydrolase family 18 protein [Geodermatophilus sp. DSM 44513]|uniref:glycosyl hydrolase family 18 protein n=1 Tax=Geodermatophilus sp. DSM 44513 TaxID=1528104 RepID=UPI00127FC981|nr:glycosyl hydrolase family 18 protein [Geodermatophilus sp. DSM 44513]WNV76049.1 glycosyl hydrolase family 18 protein [Geodermatophilus sp. DSM 44513]